MSASTSVRPRWQRLASCATITRNWGRGRWQITAYNHGANGMKRAVDTVGTTDFVSLSSAIVAHCLVSPRRIFTRNSSPPSSCRRTTSSTLVTCCLRSPPGRSRLRPVRWASRALLALLWSLPASHPGSPCGGRAASGDCFSAAVRGAPSGESGGAAPESRCGVNANARGGASHTSGFLQWRLSPGVAASPAAAPRPASVEPSTLARRPQP